MFGLGSKENVLVNAAKPSATCQFAKPVKQDLTREKFVPVLLMNEGPAS